MKIQCIIQQFGVVVSSLDFHQAVRGSNPITFQIIFHLSLLIQFINPDVSLVLKYAKLVAPSVGLMSKFHNHYCHTV